MTPIVTRSTAERLIRHGILTVLVLVYVVLFYRDGFYHYAESNLEKARVVLPSEQQDKAVLNPKVTSDNLERIRSQSPNHLTEIVAILDEPAWHDRQDGVFKAIWFGPGGVLSVQTASDGVITGPLNWEAGAHSESDIHSNVVLFYILLPLGAILLVNWIFIATATTRLDDSGLKLPLKPRVPFEAMKSWDTADFKKKGRIRLFYEGSGGEGSVVLDDYKMKAFPEIVGEIASRKNFENPIETQNDTEGEAEPLQPDADSDQERQSS